MWTLADLAGLEGFARVPRIERSAVRLLWHAGYWDGPRSGMLEYAGEACWFEVVAESEEDGEGWSRRFAVIRLTPEQHAEELRWHELFRRHVGEHTDYDAEGGRRLGALRPREEWGLFYEAQRQRIPRDLSRNEVLGWFET
jgi:hypothetical protein